MPQIGFGAPQLLPLLALAVLVAGLYGWVFVRRRRAEARYRGSAPAALYGAGTSHVRLYLKAALVVAAVALVALAVARPQIGSHRTLLQREGTDVIIAFDTSLSMSAQDVQPSRMERAKAAVGALLDHLQGDRVGLVTFAGSANLRFPLTTDVEAARKVVQSLTFKDGGLGAGTSIAQALRETTDGFANDQTRSKIVVLVSDGEDLGDDAAGAASFVRSEGISLNTIGVGLPAPAPVLTTDPRTGRIQPRTDPTTQQPLTTTADPKALQQLATDNRGRYYDGNSDDFAVQLSDEVGRLQKTRFESGEGNVPNERFQWLLGLGLLLLGIEFVLPAGRSARRFPRFRRRAQPAPATAARPAAPAGGPLPGGAR
jgi:Ca-activated chloride channel family protein